MLRAVLAGMMLREIERSQLKQSAAAASSAAANEHLYRRNRREPSGSFRMPGRVGHTRGHTGTVAL